MCASESHWCVCDSIQRTGNCGMPLRNHSVASRTRTVTVTFPRAGVLCSLCVLLTSDRNVRSGLHGACVEPRQQGAAAGQVVPRGAVQCRAAPVGLPPPRGIQVRAVEARLSLLLYCLTALADVPAGSTAARCSHKCTCAPVCAPVVAKRSCVRLLPVPPCLLVNCLFVCLFVLLLHSAKSA